jgi:hypothetical protein
MFSSLNRKFALPLVFSAAALCLIQPARAGTIDVGYVVEIAGSTVMKASYHADMTPGRFAAALTGKTSGVSSMLAGYKMNWAAEGSMNDRGFIPGTFENNRKKKSKKAKSTGLTWLPGGKVTIGTHAGPAAVPASVAAALGKSSSDPLTAVLRMANAQSGRPCSGRYRVYDGKDLFDLSLSFKKSITLASASPSEAKALECRLTYAPVAGSAVDKGETAVETYGLFLAPVKVPGVASAHYVPVRLTGKSKGLSVVISATAIAVDGQPVSARLLE